MKKRLTLLLFGLLVTLPCAFADTVLVGGTSQAPDTDLVTTGLNLITSTTGTITTPTFSADYTEWVYRDPNVTNACSAGGCVDFIVQFTDNGVDYNDSLTVGNFAGYTVDAGYALGSGGELPASVNRSDDGSVVGYVLDVTAGQTSALLDIQTNAPSYTPGFISIQDDTAGSGTGFGPAGLPGPNDIPPPSQSPEPGTYGLIGFGLAGLGLLRRRSIVQQGRSGNASVSL